MRTKEQINEYCRAWRAANKDRVAFLNRRAYLENREARKAYAKAYTAAHPEPREKASARMKAWRSTNPDRDHNAWQKANPERIRELQRDWCRANPEHAVAKAHTRRVKAAENGGRLTRGDIRAVKDMASGICAYCLCLGATDVEHCTPIARRGRNEPANVVMACRACNLAKGTQTVLEFMLDFRI